jgi:hypothetical protein
MAYVKDFFGITHFKGSCKHMKLRMIYTEYMHYFRYSRGIKCLSFRFVQGFSVLFSPAKWKKINLFFKQRAEYSTRIR